MDRIGPLDIQSILAFRPTRTAALKIGAPLLAFCLILLAPLPPGLTEDGQRTLAIMALVVALWATEVVPVAVAGIFGVVLLMLLGGAADMGVALYGFSQPVTYFLLGILTLGLAVHQSGLAERLATFLIRGAGGSPRALYVQMLFSFALLTFALPSASTRGAIMVHIYAQVMDRWQIEKDHPLYQAIMLALGSLNRLGSTALLAGGITPVVASGLLGDFSWTRWFILMSVPFYVNLAVGGTLLYLYHRSGFRTEQAANLNELATGPVRIPEIKAALIVIGTAMLWFTDFAHGLHPATPALIAMALILMPKVGLISWQEFERSMSWSSFFAIATSLSLAHGLVSSGAAAWFAQALAASVDGLQSVHLVLLALALAAALVRLVVPNIAGYLALIIPIAMAAGESLGFNPLVFGLAVVVVGDSVIYYAAGSGVGVFIFQQANLSAPRVFIFGLIMTLVSIGTLFAIAIPYWGLVGESLLR